MVLQCCSYSSSGEKLKATYYILIIFLSLLFIVISLSFANRVNRNLHDHCKNITTPSSSSSSSSSTRINLSLVSLMVCSRGKSPARRRSHRPEELSLPENNVPNTSAATPLARRHLD